MKQDKVIILTTLSQVLSAGMMARQEKFLWLPSNFFPTLLENEKEKSLTSPLSRTGKAREKEEGIVLQEA